jgi:hypothetical protein
MTMMDRLKDLPDWPARMTAPVAAPYMCVSQSTFLTRFGSAGVKEGGSTFWARAVGPHHCSAVRLADFLGLSSRADARR